MIMKEPFYGIFLATLNKTETKQVKSAGVRKNGINLELGINPDEWEKLPANIRHGLIKHEVLHICMGHITMRDNYADKELFNIAADIEINQYIDDNLKNGYEQSFFICKEDFDPTLRDYAGTDYYYNELQKQKGKNPKLDNLLQQLKENSINCSANNDWDLGEASEMEKQLIDKQVNHQLKQAKDIAKNRGNLPKFLQEKLDKLDLIEEPVLDWKAFLRRFSGGSTKYYTKKSRRKQSNRFDDSPGLKIKQKNHLFVAVDTSGSVSRKEFEEFMQQIHHIYKSGTEVTIAHADADVSHVEAYKGKITRDRYGNGGTDFTPAIKYFNRHKQKYTSMVYFTDGECTPPNVKPQKPMLWVISSVGKKLDSLPGLQIQIPVKK